MLMCHQSWNYIFYFEYPVHALMVKQGIAKGNFFLQFARWVAW
jgi:hypothetical protein